MVSRSRAPHYWQLLVFWMLTSLCPTSGNGEIDPHFIMSCSCLTEPWAAAELPSLFLSHWWHWLGVVALQPVSFHLGLQTSACSLPCFIAQRSCGAQLHSATWHLGSYSWQFGCWVLWSGPSLTNLPWNLWKRRLELHPWLCSIRHPWQQTGGEGAPSPLAK